MKRILLILFWLVSIGGLSAQNVEYGVELDTNYMLIGDQQHLIFKVRCEAGLKITFPLLKDTVVNGVEIIEGPVRDSIMETDGRWLVSEQYVITAFDTGVYMIPSMPITVAGQEYDNILRTDPIGFAVNSFQIDPQKGNYDIVMPYDAPWTFAEILPYLLWGILAVAILVLGWWLWHRYGTKKSLFETVEVKIPPFQQAIQTLDAIKEEKLWLPGHEKVYYTRLVDAIRLYLSGEFAISAMEQTSAEILRDMKACDKIKSEECMMLEDLLTVADFVKFAKFTPLQDESVRHLECAYRFVNDTHVRLEAEREEKMKAEQEKDNMQTEVAKNSDMMKKQ